MPAGERGGALAQAVSAEAAHHARTAGCRRSPQPGHRALPREWIAFLDDDDIFLSNHLEAAHKTLTSPEQPDFVYLGALVSNERRTTAPADWSTLHRKAYEFDERFLLAANPIHTGSVVVRNFRATAVRFDESLSHCEDWDLWIALRKRLGYRFRFVDDITSVYHQVPGTPGLVAAGQSSVPSPFTVARNRIHAKWPSDDPQTRACRVWLDALEVHRNAHISAGREVPVNLFDRVLRYLHDRFSQGGVADLGTIAAFFEEEL